MIRASPYKLKWINDFVCANMNTRTYQNIHKCHHLRVEVHVVRSELLDIASSGAIIIDIANDVNCAKMELSSRQLMHAAG